MWENPTPVFACGASGPQARPGRARPRNQNSLLAGQASRSFGGGREQSLCSLACDARNLRACDAQASLLERRLALI